MHGNRVFQLKYNTNYDPEAAIMLDADDFGVVSETNSL